jgi:hypothetical protein
MRTFFTDRELCSAAWRAVGGDGAEPHLGIHNGSPHVPDCEGRTKAMTHRAALNREYEYFGSMNRSRVPSLRIRIPKGNGPWGFRAIDLPAESTRLNSLLILEQLLASDRVRGFLLPGQVGVVPWRKGDELPAGFCQKLHARPQDHAASLVHAAVREGFGTCLELDLRDAFALVPHEAATTAMKELGIPQAARRRVLELVRIQTVDRSGNLVRRNGRGLEQGNPLSPLVFALALALVLRELETDGHRVSAYLDDIYVMARSLAGAHAAFEKFSAKAKEHGFTGIRPLGEGHKESRIREVTESDPVVVLKTYEVRPSGVGLVAGKTDALLEELGDSAATKRRVRSLGGQAISRNWMKSAGLLRVSSVTGGEEGAGVGPASSPGEAGGEKDGEACGSTAPDRGEVRKLSALNSTAAPGREEVPGGICLGGEPANYSHAIARHGGGGEHARGEGNPASCGARSGTNCGATSPANYPHMLVPGGEVQRRIIADGDELLATENYQPAADGSEPPGDEEQFAGRIIAHGGDEFDGGNNNSGLATILTAGLFTGAERAAQSSPIIHPTSNCGAVVHFGGDDELEESTEEPRVVDNSSNCGGENSHRGDELYWCEEAVTIRELSNYPGVDSGSHGGEEDGYRRTITTGGDVGGRTEETAPIVRELANYSGGYIGPHGGREHGNLLVVAVGEEVESTAADNSAMTATHCHPEYCGICTEPDVDGGGHESNTKEASGTSTRGVGVYDTPIGDGKPNPMVAPWQTILPREAGRPREDGEPSLLVVSPLPDVGIGVWGGGSGTRCSVGEGDGVRGGCSSPFSSSSLLSSYKLCGLESSVDDHHVSQDVGLPYSSGSSITGILSDRESVETYDHDPGEPDEGAAATTAVSSVRRAKSRRGVNATHTPAASVIRMPPDCLDIDFLAGGGRPKLGNNHKVYAEGQRVAVDLRPLRELPQGGIRRAVGAALKSVRVFGAAWALVDPRDPWTALPGVLGNEGDLAYRVTGRQPHPEGELLRLRLRARGGRRPEREKALVGPPQADVVLLRARRSRTDCLAWNTVVQMGEAPPVWTNWPVTTPDPAIAVMEVVAQLVEANPGATIRVPVQGALRLLVGHPCRPRNVPLAAAMSAITRAHCAKRVGDWLLLAPKNARGKSGTRKT